MTRPVPWIGLFALLLTIGPAAAAVPVGPGSATVSTENIDRDVRALLRRFEVPGAIVQVIQDGRILFSRAYGVRNLASRPPVRRDTLFEIGSITKQFTAASIMQLQERGLLDIDQRLSTYLPDAPHADEITLRQLLSHTSGLHDYFDGPAELMDRIVTEPISYEALIARTASRPLDFPPGSRWSYSNTGYALLGRVIEVVSGESYRDYLQHHFFDPLNMRETRTTADIAGLRNMAAGYRHARGRVARAPAIHPTWGGAAGFLVSTVDDLARWDAALGSGRVVSMTSYREMTRPFVTSGNENAGYGLGLFVGTVFGQPRIGHTGGAWGFTAADEYFPGQNLRIIAFTNLGDEAPEAAEALTNVIFANLYPALAAEAQRPAPGENLQITRDVRAAVAELQAGRGYSRFSSRLRDRLAGDPGARFAARLGPYGQPTNVVFRGVRRTADQVWHDYEVRFGPGVMLPFAVRIGEDRLIAGFSVG